MLKDISQETSLVKAIEFIKSSTRIAPKSASEDIETLNYKEKNGSLIINYDYQRNFIQTVASASAYIESIFLGLIIPEIQVFEDYDTGNREIIDGQQRVLSLLKFYRNEYKLTGLKEFPELNGLTYEKLPQELKNIIRTFQVNIRIFTNTDDLYKYTIFERLNTGTKKLNSQEVRNCVYRGAMLEIAKKVASLEVVEKLLVGVKNNRYQRVEVVLSIMSLMCLFENDDMQEELSVDSMKKRINRFLEISRDFSEEDMARIAQRFIEVVEFVSRNFDVKHIANIMYPEQINFFAIIKTVCESLCVAFSRYDLNECQNNIEEIREGIYGILKSEQYKDTVGTIQGRTFESIDLRNELIKEEIIKHIEVCEMIAVKA